MYLSSKDVLYSVQLNAQTQFSYFHLFNGQWHLQYFEILHIKLALNSLVVSALRVRFGQSWSGGSAC